MKNELTDVSRREFLKTATASALALVGSATLVSALSGCGKDDPTSSRTGEKVSFNLNESGFEALRTVGGILRRNFGANRNGGRDVIIRRVAETEFRTVSVVCPHAGCDVGTPTQTQVECPCHNSVFSMQASNFGARIGGIAPRGLTAFETAFNAETQVVTITF
ncbi:MAG: Rieske 2Fe-2S domain-containing protein [Chloroherpetonaceae bacterium]|nr:Rieske 2Fe-2S domain-containing protein [Chloroherpetonaceae bacterium]MDW8437190.1 Rieske 2Fe-2S domain-containing protein [Chloroherpetonaceae bacterium]